MIYRRYLASKSIGPILLALLFTACTSDKPRAEVQLPAELEQRMASSGPGANGSNAIARRAAEDFIGMKGISPI